MLSAIVYHKSSNLTDIKLQMGFKKFPALNDSLPSEETVERMGNLLKHSTCAVVGAGASLETCAHRDDICKHDIVIHVNDHPEILKYCPRMDIQVINAHACKYDNKHRIRTLAHDGIYRRCNMEPRLFRLRTEWNVKSSKNFARNAWLSSGRISKQTKQIFEMFGGRCCATTGGNAVAFALYSCQHVSVYGVGRGSNAYVGQPHHKLVPSVHNIKIEQKWIEWLWRIGRVHTQC